MTVDKISIADYLFQRLAQLGISHVFGVPGDFNLTLLDHIYFQPQLKWVGFCNELNAAYAADGFGRVKRSPAALITTYGVGELSAINGISGAHAEQVPIIHIVGTTARPIQEQQLLIHHVTPGRGLNPPDHKIYAKVSEPFSCATEYLYNVNTAAEQIDPSVGAAFALRELGGGRRVVLLEGDGSSQMTIQELGTMVRFNLDVSIFLLNNSGYSIERAIWGPDQGYNDICPNWKWTKLLETFGGIEGKTVLSKRVDTENDLKKITTDKDGFGKLAIPRLVEVILDAKDYPWRLEKQIEVMGAKNRDMIIEYAAKHDI
ncbi:hypothetical protein D0Z03_002308 [Geotrichum reessii]|nr:hypothetical protein D0Z03_002308 [Galactomyces reessii]